jgi:hypothetical protein
MRRYWIFFIAAGLAPGLPGCGNAGRPAPQENLDRAQASLQASLDAWKKGAKPNAFKAPAVELADPDWQAGFRLVDYMIYSTEGRQGEGVRCGVVLSMRDRQGKTLSKDVSYRIQGDAELRIDRAAAD